MLVNTNQDGELLCPQCDNALVASVKTYFWNVPIYYDDSQDVLDTNVMDASSCNKIVIGLKCNECTWVVDLHKERIDVRKSEESANAIAFSYT